jgi:hypothetical protein
VTISSGGCWRDKEQSVASVTKCVVGLLLSDGFHLHSTTGVAPPVGYQPAFLLYQQCGTTGCTPLRMRYRHAIFTVNSAVGILRFWGRNLSVDCWCSCVSYRYSSFVSFWLAKNLAELADGPTLCVRCLQRVICIVASAIAVAVEVTRSQPTASEIHWQKSHRRHALVIFRCFKVIGQLQRSATLPLRSVLGGKLVGSQRQPRRFGGGLNLSHLPEIETRTVQPTA